MYSLVSGPEGQSESDDAQPHEVPKGGGRGAAELSRLPDALVDVPIHYTIACTNHSNWRA